ncbi:hypothetical protein CCP3SC1_20026 [Gammaproteobacteria bacterium]
MGMHPATLLRRVLVGITDKPEVIVVYDRMERNHHNGCAVFRDPRRRSVAGWIPMRSVGTM